jgi:undecaprenyl diphosphate synthase
MRGAERVKEAVKVAVQEGVEVLTVYAFSTENWKRDPSEVAALWRVIEENLRREQQSFAKQRIRVVAVGEVERLPASLQELIADIDRAQAAVEVELDGGWTMTLVLALSYGGRAEIVRAAQALVKAACEGELKAHEVTEESFRRALGSGHLPDADLVIRTGGEHRLSNREYSPQTPPRLATRLHIRPLRNPLPPLILTSHHHTHARAHRLVLLWHAAYAEVVSPEVYWPDFDGDAMRQAISTCRSQERRFGR